MENSHALARVHKKRIACLLAQHEHKHSHDHKTQTQASSDPAGSPHFVEHDETRRGRTAKSSRENGRKRVRLERQSHVWHIAMLERCESLFNRGSSPVSLLVRARFCAIHSRRDWQRRCRPFSSSLFYRQILRLVWSKGKKFSCLFSCDPSLRLFTVTVCPSGPCHIFPVTSHTFPVPFPVLYSAFCQIK